MFFPVFAPFFMFFFPDPKPEEREDAPSREKLLSASERLRVPTPAERLLDQCRVLEQPGILKNR